MIDPNDPNAVFTGPPPNAAEAEINAWVDLWFCHHKFTPGSTTPPQWVQTWIDNAHAHFMRQTAVNASSNHSDTTIPEENQLAAPAAAAAHAEPPPDVVRAQIENMKQENQLLAAQIASMKDTDRDVKGIQQQLPAKRKAPTANTEDNHPSSVTETATTVADANPSVTAENTTIAIDAQGDTVEDPIVINESTSNSDNDSADEADKST